VYSVVAMSNDKDRKRTTEGKKKNKCEMGAIFISEI
jgi:hypothetical protein